MLSEKEQFQEDLLESARKMRSGQNSMLISSTFKQKGYITLKEMLAPERLGIIEAVLDATTTNSRQMLQFGWCKDLAHEIRRQLVAKGLIQIDYAAVLCTCFEKSTEHNWLVAYHQDLSIPVKFKVEHPALGGWSEKDGVFFVQPPDETLAQLVALRLHIDECGQEDGALKVIPGSHRAGRLNEPDKARLREATEEVLCPVAKGAGMAMSPLLLHASSKASGSSRRRVLHFLFGPPALPYGLEWASPD
ncbi:MAG TPA: phytanoyl-CoA dioxygenase family protein [Duganella sp.]|nr:phytanoyl-CoA dioxygenase family protein [Duganella sp.]